MGVGCLLKDFLGDEVLLERDPGVLGAIAADLLLFLQYYSLRAQAPGTGEIKL